MVWSEAKLTTQSRPKQKLAKRFLDALKGRIRKVHSKQFPISLLRAEQNQCLSILIFSLDLWKWSRLQVSRSKMLTYFSYGIMPWTVFQYNVLTCFVDLLKPVQYPLCTVVCPAPDGVLCNWSERSACDQRSNLGRPLLVRACCVHQRSKLRWPLLVRACCVRQRSKLRWPLF